MTRRRYRRQSLDKAKTDMTLAGGGILEAAKTIVATVEHAAHQGLVDPGAAAGWRRAVVWLSCRPVCLRRTMVSCSRRWRRLP